MTFPKGAMLQRPIKTLKMKTANHIGIYIGNNEVIHFGYPAANKILKTSLSGFAGSSINIKSITQKQSPDNEKHGKNICKNAALLLNTKENEYNKKYSILLNNCEDFARACYGNVFIVNDQWEDIRGGTGEVLSKLSGHASNTVGKVARQMGNSAMAKNAIGKSAGVTARSTIKSAVKVAHKTAVGKKAIQSVAKASLGKSVYGGAAINNVSKLARGNAVVGTVTTVALTGPDFYRALFDKSVSWKQVAKNLATNGAMVAGGIGGWAGGAALGSPLGPVGALGGALIGSIVASTAAKKVAKSGLDILHTDDSKKMKKLVENASIKLGTEFKFTKSEFELLIEFLKGKMDVKWLREVYKSGKTDSERAKFAYSQCRGMCYEIRSV
ncbi:MAG: lecithin retinol acyltransferase family protein [Desulfobacula sp.]|uniref:lecithin retinol acyltransferase family protein n=1 Tax=Desulfobacula sp. TaxID=2593537 RepID=UPI0025C53CF6|nr:lecithin retinol acyltransferase family protein [Desulfobacula sp.]MCD4718483.1 lecithin retinol acyltransferase family protein [Desulfobacula sp.]